MSITEETLARWTRHRTVAENIYRSALAELRVRTADEPDAIRHVAELVGGALTAWSMGQRAGENDNAFDGLFSPLVTDRPALEIREPGLTDAELAELQQFEDLLDGNQMLTWDQQSSYANLVRRRDQRLLACPRCGGTALGYEEGLVDNRGVDDVDMDEKVITIGPSSFSDGDGDPGLHCADCGLPVDAPEGFDEDYL